MNGKETQKDLAAPGRPSALRRPAADRHSSIVRHSFVVRIWREEDDAGWRGWVEHTRSGEASFVQELEELLAFIEGRTGKLVP